MNIMHIMKLQLCCNQLVLAFTAHITLALLSLQESSLTMLGLTDTSARLNRMSPTDMSNMDTMFRAVYCFPANRGRGRLE